MVGDSDTGMVPGEPAPRPEAGGIAASEDPKLLERVPAIIYVADTGGDGRWHYVSPQIEAILNYSTGAPGNLGDMGAMNLYSASDWATG